MLPCFRVNTRIAVVSRSILFHGAFFPTFSKHSLAYIKRESHVLFALKLISAVDGIDESERLNFSSKPRASSLLKKVQVRNV